jgi:hypothetical protein
VPPPATKVPHADQALESSFDPAGSDGARARSDKGKTEIAFAPRVAKYLSGREALRLHQERLSGRDHEAITGWSLVIATLATRSLRQETGAKGAESLSKGIAELSKETKA